MDVERRAFHNAKARCQCKTATGYENYGGRGIEFRFSDFKSFYDHVGPKPSPMHTLDRVNNEGHYEEGNIRWVVRADQNRNRRPVSEEGRKRMSIAAKARCTEEWRKRGK